MKEISDINCGTIGEHLVCADILSEGYNAFLSTNNLPYDLIMEDHNNKIYRVQVKTTRTTKAISKNEKKGIYTPVYQFNARRCGKNGRRSYNNTDFDIISFVALDKKSIWYMSIDEVKQTMFFRLREYEELYVKTKCHSTYYYDKYTLERSIKRLHARLL